MKGGWYCGRGVAHWFAHLGAKSAMSICGHLALVKALREAGGPKCGSCQRLLTERR